MPREPDETPHGHEPVLLDEVMALLAPRSGELAVDCTLGRGGHALALAEAVSPGGKLVAFDVDPDNLRHAESRLAGQAVELHLTNFAEAERVLDGRRADVLLADLGTSANQLTDPDRGLSFGSPDAPLDMRLDPDLPETAADLLRRWPEKAIADTIYQLGDERFSRRIARRIVERRKAGSPVARVGDLKELVRRCVPRPRRTRGPAIDPATRTFMALRMAVNDEAGVLSRLLAQLPTLLAPRGRAAFISFHSGEDRLVKNALREFRQAAGAELLTRKPITATEGEAGRNPRSRSAKLRAIRWVG